MRLDENKRHAVEGRIFDLLVVGAGTAGSVAAFTAAKKGLSVCLVDQKPSEDVGTKTCGDALVSTHLEELNKLIGLPPPPESVIAQNIHGLVLVSPNEEYQLKVEDPGLTLNRHAFGQWLLQLALDEKVIFLDSTKVVRPVIVNDAITGVKAQFLREEQEYERIGEGVSLNERLLITIRSRVTMDASGVSGALRKHLPESIKTPIPKHIKKEALGMCYREIRQLGPNEVLPHPHHCVVHFTKKVAPGGYVWWFPQAKDKVNVGIGFRFVSTKLSPYRQFQKFMENHPLLHQSIKIHGSGGVVPLSRPLINYVGSGFLLAGDVAQQVNPLDGAGIGYSMIGGALGSITVAKALGSRGKEKDTSYTPLSTEELWPYNHAFFTTEGAKHMGLAVLATFLNNVRDQDLDFGFANEIITAEDILRATHSEGEGFKLPAKEKVKRLIKGGSRVGLIMDLNRAIKHMKGLSSHYKHYPEELKNFPPWVTKLNKLLGRAEKDLKMSLA
ncbi:MAG: geranylgeranyl reductase family protein [Candidatus Ranarchaeia archaeon]|jgi:digeranylgeranylglycerophospholipid reductase